MQKQIQTFQQKQALTMSHSMYQSISVLKMSNTEILEFVAKELECNPFIEDASTEVEYHHNDSDAQKTDSDNNANKSLYDSVLTTKKTHDNHIHDNFLSNIKQKKSLKEHVIEQINLTFDEHKEKLIAYYLLDSLSSTGYLTIDLHQACVQLKCKRKMLDNVLKQMKDFDPLGIFSQSLKEYLLLQLEDQGIKDPNLIALAKNIHLIAANHLKKLTCICNVSMNELLELIKRIKAL